MTEQDSTKLLFLLEQYRPEPHAVKATDTEMTNLPSAKHKTVFHATQMVNHR